MAIVYDNWFFPDDLDLSLLYFWPDFDLFAFTITFKKGTCAS